MKIKPLLVLPSLPERISPLQELAHNVWYAWSPDLVQLFRRLDQDVWEAVNQNPVKMLAHVSQERLREAADDESFVAHLMRVYEKFKAYMAQKKWFETRFPACKEARIAYFSAEFGLDVSLPMYSGGLGVLSGDHLKTASDLGVPIVAVGILYRYGYFTQKLNADGWQLETYTENDWYNMPVELMRDDKDEPIKITVDIADCPVQAQIWKVQVGRVPLYLLDTNIPENPSLHREITSQLYSGDKDIRIRQEILLGIGGVRALHALGYEPQAYHLNEGHSMFLCLERIRYLMETQKLTFDEAAELVWTTNIFTTHTPVPAGNETFDTKLMEKYLARTAGSLGMSFNDLMRIGRVFEEDEKEAFSMTVGALRLSAHANGVSELHGKTSREMWRHVFPGYPTAEVPISSITNGVHTYSWISPNMGELYSTYLGPRYLDQPEDPSVWEKVERIPDGELWRTHQQNKEHLIFFTRRRLRRQLEEKGKPQHTLNYTEEVLDPHTLTIGFARRFAAYKRGHLLFHDLDRLRQLIENEQQPVQFIFAGKAHPRDQGGKEIIKSIMHIAQREEFRQRIVFLENYDLDLAYHLVGGVDVWLNNPRRPQEASGTSGMKAALNGALNVSTLDGWWAEGYSPEIGWAIGSGILYPTDEEQDQIESQALYDILEREIIPFYYHHDKKGYSRDWVDKMKASILMVGQQFSAHRMIREYTERFYIAAIQGYDRLAENEFNMTREVTAWNDRIRSNWNRVTVASVDFPVNGSSARVGQTIPVTVRVFLGDLPPDDVNVEVVHGRLNAQDQIVTTQVDAASLKESRQDGYHTYHIDLVCKESGRIGITARVVPNNRIHTINHNPRIVSWLG